MSMYSYQHGVYQTIFHLVWQTKCRYKMMRKEKYRLAVKQAIEEVGKKHGMHFVELSVMPEHIHAIVSCHPSMSQSKALNLLKGGTAYNLFRAYPQLLLRYPKRHLWSKGKSGRTIGDVDKETVIEYIKKQAEQTNITQFVS